jgi:hypothetical protein
MAKMTRLLLDSHQLWQVHRLWFERPQLEVYEALHFPFREDRAPVAMPFERPRRADPTVLLEIQ